MELLYESTRNSKERLTASGAILKGLAGDGGLFVPKEIPRLPLPLDEFGKMGYKETAYTVLKEFLTDFTQEELSLCIERAYDGKFDTEEIAPVKKAGDKYYLELFHGATLSFKDMALSILPHLLSVSAKKYGVENEIVILAPTSGDTGKAAMSAFADVKGVRIIVFYPKNGVSRVQELQMLTQKGKNVYTVAVDGNFDDAQSGVKAMFEDKELEQRLRDGGYQFSSANSMNIGRFLPQIVYYVYAYARLLASGELREGEELNAAVPTGNFGNILAARYAKQMGVPFGRLICASNENKVLFDFFKTGIYDRNRRLVITSSPSMDILISSNVERLIHLSSGGDCRRTAELMRELKEGGVYEISEGMRERMRDFAGGYASESEGREAIKDVYEKTGRVIDPHTAVAVHVSENYRKETGDMRKCLIAATASPYKFAKSVMGSLDERYKEEEDLSLFPALSEASGTQIPRTLRKIGSEKAARAIECPRDKMKETVKNILGLK